MTNKLTEKRCIPCEGGVAPLTSAEITKYKTKIPDWDVNEDNTLITRDFAFTNYHQTMAFVNAVAWLAHQDNHHPDLEVGYNHCRVNYMTHAIGGLSENDIICAAKVDNLFNL